MAIAVVVPIGMHGVQSKLREADMPSWSDLSDVIALKEIETGGQEVGNGGDGYNSGDIETNQVINFHPENEDGEQENVLMAEQEQSVTVGIGGRGGDENSVEGGDVSVALLHDAFNWEGFEAEEFSIEDFLHF